VFNDIRKRAYARRFCLSLTAPLAAALACGLGLSAEAIAQATSASASLATFDWGNSLKPIGQLDTDARFGTYQSTNSQAAMDKNSTCKATVYTMVARALGMNAKIDDFWSPSDGAVVGALSSKLDPRGDVATGTVIQSKQGTGLSDVVSKLGENNPVILRGSILQYGAANPKNPTPGTNYYESHFMLAVGVNSQGNLVANDPLSGQQVTIDKTTGQVINPPEKLKALGFNALDKKFGGYQVVTLTVAAPGGVVQGFPAPAPGVVYDPGRIKNLGNTHKTAAPSPVTPVPVVRTSNQSSPSAYNQNESANSDGLQAALQPAYRNGGGVATSGPGVAGLMMASKLDFHIGTSNDFSSYNLPSVRLSGNRGSASLLDTGSNASAGDMYWGRWAGPGSTMTNSSGTVTGQSLHYIYGAPVTNMPTSGVVTYNPAGGTRPSDSAGNAGTFNGGAVQVNFATRGVTVQNLNFTSAAGSTFNLNGTATYNSNALFQTTLAGTCAGGNCTGGAATGNAVGAFTGNQAAALGLSYAGANSGTGVIVGVQAFKR